MSNQIAIMAERLSIEPEELHNIVINTLMPAKVQVSNEQFVSFLAVANEYGLNPLSKQIYAFPAKGGGIQPVVSIDGWIKIAQNSRDWNGMKHQYERENGKIVSCTCQIFRKSMDHPIEATEYLDECMRPTEPWKNWPSRMLKHKATIQAIRYAFGISGIVEPDEAERANDIKDITPTAKHKILQEAVVEKVNEEWLKETLDSILNVQNPGEIQVIFADAMGICEKHGDRDAAARIKEECKSQQAYFDELEANGSVSKS